MRDLRLVAGCGCGDDFCQSFYTEAARRVLTAPATGASLFFLRRAMLNLDVVNGRIMYVEVIDRPPLGNGRRDEPGNP
ncbi:MAG: hypothetical protein ACLPKE_11395 [Streptosporangiaceae bacterium]